MTSAHRLLAATNFVLILGAACASSRPSQKPVPGGGVPSEVAKAEVQELEESVEELGSIDAPLDASICRRVDNHYVFIKDKNHDVREEIIQKSVIVPHVKDGSIDGLVLRETDKGKFSLVLGGCGFQPGDVIHRVNDAELDSPFGGMVLFGVFNDRLSFTAELTRRDEKITVVVLSE